MATGISGQFLSYDPQYTYADVTDLSGTVIRRDITSVGQISYSNVAPNVSVSAVELEELKDDSKLLYALIDAGVEEWDGYQEAIAIWRQSQ